MYYHVVSVRFIWAIKKEFALFAFNGYIFHKIDLQKIPIQSWINEQDTSLNAFKNSFSLKARIEIHLCMYIAALFVSTFELSQ